MSHFKFGALIEGIATTATSGGTTTLIDTSKQNQVFTGVLLHTVVLPDATTLVNGQSYTIANRSDQVVTVQFDDNSEAKITAPDTQAKFLLRDNGSSNGTWDIENVGTGTGGVGINYITNPDFETNVSTWNRYKDAVQTTPEDGSGAGFSIGFVRTVVAGEVLRDTASAGLSKNGINRQGEGVSTDFSIDPQDENKNLTVSFDYKAASPYVSGDLRVFIFDIDNVTLIGAVSNDDNGDILAATNPNTFVGQFQATDSSNYRLIYHIASTTTSSWAVQIDNVSVGPDVLVPGVIITQWEKVSDPDALWNGTIGNGSIEVSRRQIADSMEIIYSLTTGSTTAFPAGGIVFTIPDSKTIDTTKSPTGGTGIVAYGSAYAQNVGTAHHAGIVAHGSTTTLNMYSDGAGAAWSNVVPFTWNVASQDQLSVHAMVPISEFSVGAVFSTTEINLQTIRAVYEATSSSANTSFADNALEIIDADNQIVDTHSAVTTGVNWEFKAPRAGNYLITVTMAWANVTNMDATHLDLFINGSREMRLNRIVNAEKEFIPGTTVITLVKDDTVDFRALQDDSASAARSISTTAGLLTRVSITSLPDFNTFSVFGENDFLAAASSNFLLTTAGYVTAEWAAMTGNSVNLTPGIWQINGYVRQSFSSGTPPSITKLVSRWSEENGDNTTTVPDAIGTSGNVSLQAGSNQCLVYEPVGSFNEHEGPVQTIRVLVTVNQTVYLNQFLDFTVAGTNAFFSIRIYAERIG